MKSRIGLKEAMVVCLLAPLAGSAGAAHIYWTDWTVAGTDMVTGAVALPGPSSVGVTYMGKYIHLYTDVDGTGTNYWTPFAATYADGVRVENGPVLSDVISLFDGGGFQCSVTFSEPVTNPVMAIVSLGRNHITASVAFSSPFDVVSHGTGYFGSGLLLEDQNKTVLGAEGNGTLQFIGQIKTLTWTIPFGEYWYGFTVGIPVGGVTPPPPVVPAPATLLLVSFGTALVGYLHRRRAW